LSARCNHVGSGFKFYMNMNNMNMKIDSTVHSIDMSLLEKHFLQYAAPSLDSRSSLSVSVA